MSRKQHVAIFVKDSSWMCQIVNSNLVVVQSHSCDMNIWSSEDFTERHSQRVFATALPKLFDRLMYNRFVSIFLVRFVGQTCLSLLDKSDICCHLLTFGVRFARLSWEDVKLLRLPFFFRLISQSISKGCREVIPQWQDGRATLI